MLIIWMIGSIAWCSRNKVRQTCKMNNRESVHWCIILFYRNTVVCLILWRELNTGSLIGIAICNAGNNFPCNLNHSDLYLIRTRSLNFNAAQGHNQHKYNIQPINCLATSPVPPLPWLCYECYCLKIVPVATLHSAISGNYAGYIPKWLWGSVE